MGAFVTRARCAPLDHESTGCDHARVSELAASIDALLSRAESEDPAATPYLVAYFREQLTQRPDAAASAVLDRRHAAPPDLDASRYASTRVGLARLHAHTMAAISGDQLAALSSVEQAGTARDWLGRVVPLLLVLAVSSMGIGWAFDVPLCFGVGFIAILPLPILRWVVRAADYAAAAEIEQNREQLADAQMRREEQLSLIHI